MIGERYTNKTGSTVPAGYDSPKLNRERQVLSACSRIDSAQDHQAKLLEELETALQSVLRNEPVETERELETSANVPLAASLHAYAERTERHSSMIGSMLHRLEI